MKNYQARKTEFSRLITINGWNVKVYTITARDSFESKTILEKAIDRLPEWLAKSKKLQFPTYRAAFLIVHEGRDGVWSLINWWIGGEMLQTMTFLTNWAMPNEFISVPKEGAMVCVWEMAVIGFERDKWIEHILKKAGNPDFETYFNQGLTIENRSDEIQNQKSRARRY